MHCFYFLQALIHLDMGRLSDALAAGQASLAIRQKVLSNEHPDLAHSLTGKYGLCQAWLERDTQQTEGTEHQATGAPDCGPCYGGLFEQHIGCAGAGLHHAAFVFAHDIL